MNDNNKPKKNSVPVQLVLVTLAPTVLTVLAYLLGAFIFFDFWPEDENLAALVGTVLRIIWVGIFIFSFAIFCYGDSK